MDQRPKYETWNTEYARIKHTRVCACVAYKWHMYRKELSEYDPFIQELKPTIDKWSFVKLKDFFTTKTSEEEAHRMGEKLCQLSSIKD